jgi:hypothetical protein
LASEREYGGNSGNFLRGRAVIVVGMSISKPLVVAAEVEAIRKPQGCNRNGGERRFTDGEAC